MKQDEYFTANQLWNCGATKFQQILVPYLSAVLVVRVLFPFGVWGTVWNSIVSVPGHCLFIYFMRWAEIVGLAQLSYHVV